MNIDDKLKKLDEITKKLENDQASLNESLALFDEGAQIVKDCYKTLNETKGKIAVIKQDLDAFREENFEV